MFLIKFSSIVSLLICLQFCANVKATHFWVDYNGNVPENAVPGGNIDNTTTYIGQALFYNFVNFTGLLPVVINNGSLAVRAGSNDSIINMSSKLKVLCSNTDLKWEQWNDHHVSNYVVGGTWNADEPEQTVYIGRTLYEGQLFTGALITAVIWDDIITVLAFVNGGDLQYSMDYEVLAF